MAQHCKLCEAELNWPSQSSNPYTQYCIKCKTCTYCNEMIGKEDLEWCLQYEQPLAHCLCLTPELHKSIEQRKVEISQKELDLLNAAHLMVRPNIDLSIDTNCKDAEVKGMKWFNELKTLDEKFLVVRRMETLAATFSLLLKKEPGSKTIKINLDASSVERFKAVSKQDIKYERCTKCRQKFPELEVIAHQKTCEGATKTAARAATKRQTHFEKTVDMLLKYGEAAGMTINEAMIQATKMFEDQGLEITHTPTEVLK